MPRPSTKLTILVVDDDPGLRALCTATLDQEYTVLTAENGEQGLRMVYEHRPDAVLLDVTMPAMNGFVVCRRIREIAGTPVIMLTARGGEHEVARGLDAGADDYVLKPFRPVELAARIRAALRRGQHDPASASATAPELLSFQNGDLIVDTGRRVAVARGKDVALSAIEYKLLETLARHAGQVLSHDQILNNVWGYEYTGETGYVKTYIGLLRNKIEEVPGDPRFVLSRRGLGYFLDPRAPQDSTQRESRSHASVA